MLIWKSIFVSSFATLSLKVDAQSARLCIRRAIFIVLSSTLERRSTQFPIAAKEIKVLTTASARVKLGAAPICNALPRAGRELGENWARIGRELDENLESLAVVILSRVRAGLLRLQRQNVE